MKLCQECGNMMRLDEELDNGEKIWECVDCHATEMERPADKSHVATTAQVEKRGQGVSTRADRHPLEN